MRRKKHHLLIGALLLLCGTSVISVFAHPGRTDQNGGHWDRKAGTYHFHTGGYAGRGSSGSSSSYEYVPFTPPYDPPTANPYKQSETSSPQPKRNFDFLDAVVAVLVGLGALGFVCSLFYEYIYCTLLEKHLPRYKLQKLNDLIDRYTQCKGDLTVAREEGCAAEPKCHTQKEIESMEAKCKSLKLEIIARHKKCNSGMSKFLLTFGKRNKKLLNGVNAKYVAMFSYTPTNLFEAYDLALIAKGLEPMYPDMWI